MHGAAHPARPKVYVHLLYGQDAELCSDAFAQDMQPESTPYGFHRGEDYGFSPHFSRDRRLVAENIVGKAIRKLLGFHLFHALANLGSVRRCNMVWTMTEGEALAVAMLFALGLARPRPIIGNIIWLLNDWDRQNGFRRWLYRRLAHHISVWTVHSRDCLELARRCFPDNEIRLMRFGVNGDMFRPEKRGARSSGPIRIFAPGNDRTRDWPTLLAAFGGDARFVVKLACAWIDPADVAPFGNVEKVGVQSMAQFHALYRWADCVAVPMRDNIFSGITVALEAAAMAIPVLSSRTGGLPTYFAETDIIYVDVGDATGMREALARLAPDQLAARGRDGHAAFVRGDYTTDALMRQYAEIASGLTSDNRNRGGPPLPGQAHD